MRRAGLFLFLVGVAVACYIVSTANAATVAHWRFESATNFLEDSGPNNLDLTANGSPTPSYLAMPTSGPGSEFPDPVPQTGVANNGVAEFSGAGGWLSHPDDPVFSTLSDLTVEVFCNRATLDKMWLVGQLNSSNNQRAWGFGVRDENANLRPFLYYCSSGDTSTYAHPAVEDDMRLHANHDYYVAVTLDVSDTDSGLTFYLQDLTDNPTGPLQVSSVGHEFTSLFNSTALLTIGAHSAGTGYLFDGVIDEIRISNDVLSEEDLLISQIAQTYAPGDANKDGVVDAADAALLAENWGPSLGDMGWEDGDFNADGIVNAADASILAANWSSTPWESAQAPVPEPGVLIYLLSSMLGLATYRRFARR